MSGVYRIGCSLAVIGGAWALASAASAQSTTAGNASGEQARGVIVLRATPTPPAPAAPTMVPVAVAPLAKTPTAPTVATAVNPAIAPAPGGKLSGPAPSPQVAPTQSAPTQAASLVRPAPSPLRPAPIPSRPAPIPVAVVAAPASTTPSGTVAALRPVAPVITPLAAPLPAAVVKACARPFPAPAVSLTAADFDRRVAAALKPRPASMVIDVPTPFAVGVAAPTSLQPWLAQAKASGGLVTARTYCQDSRGFFGFLKAMFGGKPGGKYAAVGGYDAVLHVDGLDQKVTQVEFTRRAAR